MIKVRHDLSTLSGSGQVCSQKNARIVTTKRVRNEYQPMQKHMLLYRKHKSIQGLTRLGASVHQDVNVCFVEDCV